MDATQKSLLLVKRCVVGLGILNACLWAGSTSYLAFSGPGSSHSNDITNAFHVPGVDQPVLLQTENSVHYSMPQEFEPEWYQLQTPDNPDGIVHLPDGRRGMVGMLHSLHCLNRVRRSVVVPATDPDPRAHVEHCFTYLRSVILCAADTTLEPLQDEPDGSVGSGWRMDQTVGVTYTCRNWSAVYDEVTKNHAAWYPS
ncbi:hypothetical protein BV25DRAFT_1828408 [Artomyces pyxidatus]|uniref:Uncharacterized protein n=1 Tax=Artomyces pyxidatus TaxID=48021 RepID=A0ACB8SUU9_9AGAM|nr:hypothetical protein BV25DRAFT_1828408 [Artomyces pyxidatus]